MLIIFTFVVVRFGKDFVQKIYRQFMEMSGKDQWNAALKIKLFVFFPVQSLPLCRNVVCNGRQPSDFTHQRLFRLHWSWPIWCWAAATAAIVAAATIECPHKQRKKVWKRNIDEIYDFEQNPIMQLGSQLHTHWTTLISTSMTMQLANSGILTVGVSVFIISLFSAFAPPATQHTQLCISCAHSACNYFR